MDKIKSIFNHPKRDEPEKERGWFEWSKPAFKKDDVGQLNRLLKALGRKTKSRDKFNHTESSHHVFSEGFESNRKQKVISKISYGCSKRKHLEYLKKYMPQLTKNDVENKPELFGSDIKEYEAHLVPFHYKLIISPENQNVDLEVLTRHFIKELEHLTGYDLYWEAAIHTNTEHRHVHVALNGIDKNGQKVRFTKEMIKEKMRSILSETATDMVGERTYEEIKADEAKLPTAPRWTKLDERLSLYKGKLYPAILDASFAKRLSYLCEIKLADKKDGLYSLTSDWKEKLQMFGRYNTFMTEYMKENGNLKLYQGGHLSGVVEKTFTFDKDESWNDAIIVRTSYGKVYVPVYNLQKENLEGKKVQINIEQFNSMKKISDREIKVERESGHRSEIER